MNEILQSFILWFFFHLPPSFPSSLLPLSLPPSLLPPLPPFPPSLPQGEKLDKGAEANVGGQSDTLYRRKQD